MCLSVGFTVLKPKKFAVSMLSQPYMIAKQIFDTSCILILGQKYGKKLFINLE